MKNRDETVERLSFNDLWSLINYDSLTVEENELIRKARRAGFHGMYPAFPTCLDQDRNTLAGAKEFLKAAAKV